MSGAAANKLYAVQSGSIGLTAGTTQTIWMISPAVAPFVIAEFGVSFNASVSSLPVQIDMYIAASVGSSAGNSASVRALASTTVAATSTARTAFTVEPNPTTKQLIQSWYVQPFGGVLDIQYPLGREGLAAIGGSTTTDQIALQCTTPSGVTLNCLSYVWFEE